MGFVYKSVACVSPVTAYRSRHVGASGKRPLSFSRSDGFCDLPVTIPCGNCIGCRIDRARTWALRCVHESRMHVFNSFVTLTYDDDHLPTDTSVSKEDLQLFFKRLRKAGYAFRYFACGEYGDSNHRPHYHVIFFGIDFHADRTIYKNTKTGRLYTSPSLTQIWGNGHAVIANFSYQTAAYVARYVLKKRTGKDAGLHPTYSRLNCETGELFQVSSEFVLMSRRKGIGASWFEKFKSDAFPSDFLVHDDKKFTVPKYYLNKLEHLDSQSYLSIKQKRKQSMSASSELRSAQRLEAKEKILLSKEKLKSRSL